MILGLRLSGEESIPPMMTMTMTQSQNHKYITTVKKKLGAIGAKGSGKARLFHPSEHIRAQWPNEHQKIWLADVLLGGKGMQKVNRREQLCYECRIPEIDNGVVFHITCNNFRVETDGATPFDDKFVVSAQAPQETGPVTVRHREQTNDHQLLLPSLDLFLEELTQQLRHQMGSSHLSLP